MFDRPNYDFINIDSKSATPKYQQLANSIIEAVKKGELQKNDALPSLNELSSEFDISRDTVERGYRHLKEIGVLGSFPGKGYFINDASENHSLKIFMLFNKLSRHKKIIYDAFAATLGVNAMIDLYIYNNDFSYFKKLLSSKKEDYTHYVIIPHFIEGGEAAHEIINTIDKEKLVLLDKLLPEIEGEYTAVYENFEQDIFSALEAALPQLMKYHTIKIIFPKNSYYPKGILNGYVDFCDQYAFNKRIINSMEGEEIKKGEVYINVMEADLVVLVEKILQTTLKVGEDVGIISYNETPLKKIILQGITTISSDFNLMGIKTAELIMGNQKSVEAIPFHLTLRASL